ncbi:MAG: hypothetical protein ACOYOP_00120 [Microthrixaceae bacterium]
MSEHPHRTTFRARRGPAAVLLCLALTGAAAACAPTPPPGPAACPARTEVQLEPPDPVAFSYPRAVSPNGEWTVASRVIGTDLVLSMRPTVAGLSGPTVGSLPYAAVAAGTLLASIPADGSQVVFGLAGTAATPTAPQGTLRRWRSATGTTADLPVPVLASPPPGVAYPVNAVRLGADGRRVLWTQSFREGAEPYVWHRVLIVTDAATDAVLTTASLGGASIGWTTGDAAAFLDGNNLVATATGAVTDLNPAVTAAAAAFPGTQLYLDGVSDDLRYLALRRYDPTTVPGVFTYIVWDRTSSTGRVAYQLPSTGQVGQPLLQLDAVTPSGSIVLTRWASPPALAELVEAHPTGTVTVLSSATVLTPALSWAVTTTDGRTVLASRRSVLGQELVAERCS